MKNKKFIVLIIFLVSSHFVLSQKKIEVIYKTAVAFDEDVMNIDKKFGYLKQAIDVSDKVRYVLKIDDSISAFSKIENNSIDKMASYMLDAVSGIPKLIYTDLKKNEIISVPKFDGAIIKENEFLIKNSIIKDWELVNEEKYIEKYKCFKAICKREVKLKKGVEIQNVIAWYCPQLPYSFGPSTYNGLPGLVLELQEKNVTFGVESLQPLEDLQIQKPNRGKIITQENYIKITEERFETLRQMSKQK